MTDASTPRRLRARILSQGDEIVSGATLDTNAQWLAGELWARGVEVAGMASAPDDLAALERLVAGAAADADLVVSTGGMGPTDDDLSAAAAARAAGVGLVEDAAALAQVRERFARFGREMSPSNRKQALLPAGALVLENPEGTAPGFALDIARARAFFFAGVPRELYALARLHLFPWLEAQRLVPAGRRRLHVCGVGESVLQDRLKGLELPSGVRLGYKTWLPYNSIVLYADGGVAGTDERLAAARDAVLGRIGAEVFGEDDATLAAALGQALTARGLTLAVAESCTAGLVAAQATEAPGSSAWVVGGVVAYDNAVKRDLLGVPAEVLERHGAVSEECARAMAEGVRRRLGALVGISTTGIAGPGGGSEEKPIGMVCFALATAAETSSRTVRFGDRGREVVRTMAAATALEWLRRHIRSAV